MYHRGASRQRQRVRALWRRVSPVGAGALLVGTAVITWAGSPPAASAASPSLAFDPALVDYGSVAVGQTASATVRLSNTGRSGTGALTLSVSGPAAFGLTLDDCTGLSLGPAKSCSVTVRFSPTGGGPVTGTLSAVSARGVRATSTLSGSVGSLYWADLDNGNIDVASLDGSNVQTILTAQSTPTGLAVGPTNLYWANYRDGNPDGTIMSANLDGTDPRTLVSGVQEPLGVAVSSTNLYWTEASGTIMESGLDGSAPAAIVTGLTDPVGLAVANGQIYWDDAVTGTIDTANLDGSNPKVLVSGLSEPLGVAVANSHLYWSTFGAVSSSVGESDLDGSNQHTLVDGEANIEGVAADSGHIYWTNSFTDGKGSISEANLDGSDTQVIVSNQDETFGLAVTG